MPSTVEQLSPTRVKLTIEIPFADLKPAIDKAYAQIGSQITVPGFRKGKVPAAVINQRVGRGAVLQDAINETIPKAYAAAISEHSLTPLAQPEIDITKLEDNDLVELVAEVDVRPDFDLPDFSRVNVTVDNIADTTPIIEERTDLLRQRFATTTEVDRAAQEGDLVVLDLEGSNDGVPLEEASAQGISYILGSGGMLDGLDEAVTGLKAGDTTTFTSTLVGGALRGQEADVKVTVNKVSSRELPELNDDFAQLVSEFDTLDEMRADLADGALRQARLEQAASARDKVLEALLELTSFELPERLVLAEKEARRNQINAQLRQAGLTIESYLDGNESEPANTPEEFWENVDTSSEKSLRAQVLLDKIADDRQIGVDNQELTMLIYRKAQENGTTPEQELSHMQEHDHMGEWAGEIRRGKALGLIVAGATIKDADGNPVDLSHLNADGTISEAAPEAPEADAEEAAETEAPKAKKKKAAPSFDEAAAASKAKKADSDQE
ncbi:MAG TPA: trigger factor [Propionibacteriaceae bacterium]|nr:trigger factor [Propionibacteriaceae bacterium]